MLSSVVSQVSQLLPAPARPSPLAPLLRAAPDDSGPHSRSHFLRGWLSEEETRELLAQCCEDDISLQGLHFSVLLSVILITISGLVLAGCLAATARVACPSSPSLVARLSPDHRGRGCAFGGLAPRGPVARVEQCHRPRQRIASRHPG